MMLRKSWPLESGRSVFVSRCMPATRCEKNTGRPMPYHTVKKDIDHSLGFPVVIWNSPRRETENGRTFFDVPPGEYQRAALVELVRTPRPWTGSNIEFVRKWLRESMEKFGARADVSNPAVCKWEQKGDSPTGMAKGTEYLLRVQVAQKLRDDGVIDDDTFQRLVTDAMKFDRNRDPEPIELDGMELVGDDWGDETTGRNAAAG